LTLVEWIRKEHRIFKGLMGNVANTKASDPQTRLKLFNQAIKRLDAHGTAEEETLFKVMQTNQATRLASLEALEWHRSARHMLNEIIKLDPKDEHWLPKFLVASGIIVAHIKVEEKNALSTLQQAFKSTEISRSNRDFRSVEDGILRRETQGTYKMASKLKY